MTLENDAAFTQLGLTMAPAAGVAVGGGANPNPDANLDAFKAAFQPLANQLLQPRLTTEEKHHQKLATKVEQKDQLMFLSESTEEGERATVLPDLQPRFKDEVLQCSKNSYAHVQCQEIVNSAVRLARAGSDFRLVLTTLDSATIGLKTTTLLRQFIFCTTPFDHPGADQQLSILCFGTPDKNNVKYTTTTTEAQYMQTQELITAGKSFAFDQTKISELFTASRFHSVSDIMAVFANLFVFMETLVVNYRPL